MDQDSPPSPDKPSSGSNQSSGLVKFWTELRRRKVVRVAVTYGVVAWLLIQISATVFPQFEIPKWGARFVTLLLAIGFPIAIILAWAFELTPDGIKTTKVAQNELGDAPVSEKLQRKKNWVPVIFAAAVPTLIFGALAVFFFFRSDVNRSIEQANRVVVAQQLLEIDRLSDLGEYGAAFALVSEVEPLLDEDTATDEFWAEFTWSTDIVTDPPGAQVYRQPVDAEVNEWEELGTTPLQSVRSARSEGYRFRIELEGHRIVELLQARHWGGKLQFLSGFNSVRLDPVDVMPEEMVRILRFTHDLVDYTDYFMDRFEVTNRAFERFVAAGGYEKRVYWSHAFVRDGKEISWQEAVSAFVDQTGRPGPSTWIGGAYPSGQGDYPVGGVSWYEAAAYAKFVNKELPTVVHHEQAQRFYSSRWLYTARSNLAGDRPWPVGENRAMTGLGVYDLFGNVREWCWNETGNSLQATRGGAWSDAPYWSDRIIPKSPWNRDTTHGIRLVKTFDDEEKLARLREPTKATPRRRDYEKEKPASDLEFQIYRRMYAYDSFPLNAEVEAVDEFENWTRERVVFDLPYGERGGAYLYIPKNSKSPTQTIIYWSGSGALDRHSIDEEPLHNFIYLVRSGRIVVLPMLIGTFDRDDSEFSITSNSLFGANSGGTQYRDYMIKWVQEILRTIDYLETREDVDSESLGYAGLSWGSENAPIVFALEDRFQAAVLESGGMGGLPLLPEVDPLNFLPHARSPTLMLNGEFDFAFPLETSQKPMFELLGTDPQHKKFISNPSAHLIPRNMIIREALKWFDHYLGKPGKNDK